MRRSVGSWKEKPFMNCAYVPEPIFQCGGRGSQHESDNGAFRACAQMLWPTSCPPVPSPTYPEGKPTQTEKNDDSVCYRSHASHCKTISPRLQHYRRNSNGVKVGC